MSYPPYPEYKDSGVEWLGRIPAGWSVKALRYLCDCLDSRRVPLNGEQRADIKGDFEYWGSGGIVDFISDWLYEEELVLLGEDGAPFFDPLRDVSFVISGKTWVNNHIHVLRPNSSALSRYICASLNSVNYRAYITGATRDKLTQADMWTIRLSVPPPAEQKQIADFLDRETEQIDNLIAEQEALVGSLTERKAAAFEHLAIVRNPERVVRLSRIATKLKRPVVPSAGIVTAFRDGQVTLRTERRAEGYTESNTGDGYQGVCQGDVVFHGLDGFAGAVGVAERDGICSPVYHVFRPIVGVDAAFLANTLRGMAVSGQLEVLAGNVRQRAVDFRSWATFGELPIALPPEAEQRDRHQRIVRNAKVDTLIAEAKALIDLLKERRSALISAAVTGKIDVRSEVLSRG